MVALIWILAFAFAATGLACLYVAWCKKGQASPRQVIIGWTALMAALIAGGWSSRTDKGVALALVLIMLIVLGGLLTSFLTAEKPPLRASKDRDVSHKGLSVRNVFARIWSGVLIGPVAGIVSLLINTALYDAFAAAQMDPTLNLTLVGFGFPILWAAFAVYAGYESRGLRRHFGIFIAALLPASYIAVLS